MKFGKILVTGGLGFLGSGFVRRLVARDLISPTDITILDNFSYAADVAKLGTLADQVNIVRGDVRNIEDIGTAMKGVDAVVHFAAETHNDNSLERPEEFLTTNVMGTHNVAMACIRSSTRLHHISTDEVFGDLPLHSVGKFSLDSTYKPSSPYSASKAASDHIVRAYARSFGLKATISNCTNNFGPHQHPEKFVPNAVLEISRGNPVPIYGSGKNVRDWIYVDDHSDGIISALSAGKPGATYLFGGGVPLSNLQMARLILGFMGENEERLAFVDDRPGHDLRYEMDYSSSTKQLKWRPRVDLFHTRLKSTIDQHLEEFTSWI